MTADPKITEEMLAFLKEYHLASLTTLRKDGSPHVVPVGFSYDPAMHVVRIITFPSAVTIPTRTPCVVDVQLFHK